MKKVKKLHTTLTGLKLKGREGEWGVSEPSVTGTEIDVKYKVHPFHALDNLVSASL